MEVQEKAKLYRDTKGVWRVRGVNAKKKDKGMAVPQALLSKLNEACDGKGVTVMKIDGQIKKVLFQDGDVHEVVKQDTHKMQESEQSLRQSMHGDAVSSEVQGDGEMSCAVLAYECALDVPKSLGKEYKNHAKSLPMMMRTNGLGATFAYLESKESKDGKHFERLKEDIMKLLRKIEPSLDEENLSSQSLAARDSRVIKELTKETILFLGWLSRFASGLIEG
ncbi:MAG: type III-B CRISPR module-associated protein Cmr5 [Chlorobiaceae bacterium]|nr:type III-B CRISPR module-associated protein Cmr5 [Chlorobiaceae bacterium]